MANEEVVKYLKKLLNLCDFTDELDDRIDCEPYYEAVDLAIKALEQEPKTGHWIFDEILDKHYYCSECKSMGVDYWDYCPYCGTRMESEAEE